MPLLSAALREAYASATPGVVVLHTLELHHPTWAGPVRLVQGFADLTATLEAGAPLDAGSTVTWTACPFAVVPPQQGQGRQEITVRIDNVGRLLMPLLEAADTNHATPVRLTYRVYVSTDLAAPAAAPVHLDLVNVEATPMQCTCTAAYADFLNRKFPRTIYRAEEFPGLAPRY